MKTILRIYDEGLKEKRESILKIIDYGNYEIIRKKPNIIGRFEFEDRRFFVKVFKRKKIFSYIFSPFRTSSSLKACEVADFMLKHGLLTPKPLISIERRGSLGFIKEDILIAEDIGEHKTLRELVQGCNDGKKFILLAADYVRKLHDSGVYNRDVNLANFLYKQRSLYLIDLNRARISKKSLGFLKRAKEISKSSFQSSSANLYGNILSRRRSPSRFY